MVGSENGGTGWVLGFVLTPPRESSVCGSILWWPEQSDWLDTWLLLLDAEAGSGAAATWRAAEGCCFLEGSGGCFLEGSGGLDMELPLPGAEARYSFWPGQSNWLDIGLPLPAAEVHYSFLCTWGGGWCASFALCITTFCHNHRQANVTLKSASAAGILLSLIHI